MSRCALVCAALTLGACYQSHERTDPPPPLRDAGPPVCPAPGVYTFDVEVVAAEGDGCPPLGPAGTFEADLRAPPPDCDGVIERAADGCCLRLDYECLAIENTRVVRGELCGAPPRGTVFVDSVVGIAGLQCEAEMRWVGR